MKSFGKELDLTFMPSWREWCDKCGFNTLHDHLGSSGGMPTDVDNYFNVYGRCMYCKSENHSTEAWLMYGWLGQYGFDEWVGEVVENRVCETLSEPL